MNGYEIRDGIEEAVFDGAERLADWESRHPYLATLLLCAWVAWGLSL